MQKRFPLVSSSIMRFTENIDIRLIQTMTADISMSGIGLYSLDAAPEVATAVSLEITFIGTDELLKTNQIGGRIVYIRKIGEVNFMGIEFDESINPTHQSEMLTTIIELKEDEKKLIEYDKLSALGRLTANVVHEIRNPITVIGGLAKRLEKSIYSGTKEREDLDSISLEAKRLEELLRDVLIFSSKPFFHREELNVNKIIDELVNTYQDVFTEHSICVNKFFGNIPTIYVDKDYLITAVKNLISNAIEAMPKGGALTITTDRDYVKGNNYIYIKVSDTGDNISEDKIRMIFEPFFTTKITKKETWLGLPITKRIVEGHGGFIRIDSRVEKGSAFILYFPFRGSWPRK
jgi:signal transduction histidine kinase